LLLTRMTSPSLDVRLTRSQSGSILDIDFVGGLTDGTVAAPVPASTSSAMPLLASSNLAGSTVMMTSGRKLKILEHRVHKVEMRQKENDESEEELVVSNLRPFLLKVGVHDHMDNPILDCSLPLRASLLYENGLPVKQTSSSEPLVVGETDVVALQGAATFKLRITSLSSHRDKQRFRIQVAPQDMEMLQLEPALCVVSDPMKSVTKLGRVAAPPLPLPSPMPGLGELGGDLSSLKRKYRDTLDVHSRQIQNMVDTQQMIMHELQSVMMMARRAALNGGLVTPKQEI